MFAQLNDLNDPAQLVKELESMASALRQQADASKLGSAMQGHPNPEFFYGRASDCCLAAADRIRPTIPPPPPPPEPKAEETPAPAVSHPPHADPAPPKLEVKEKPVVAAKK